MYIYVYTVCKYKVTVFCVILFREIETSTFHNVRWLFQLGWMFERAAWFFQTHQQQRHQQQQQAEVSTVVGVRKIGVVELNSLDPDEPKAMAACAKVDDVDCKYFNKKGKKYKVACGCWVGWFSFLGAFERMWICDIWDFLPVRVTCEQNHRIYRDIHYSYRENLRQYNMASFWTWDFCLQVAMILFPKSAFEMLLERQSDDRSPTN